MNNETPEVTMQVKDGRVVFTYTGPFPIGVGYTIKKYGFTFHKEATLVSGETDSWCASEGVEQVSCTWGYGPILTANLISA